MLDMDREEFWWNNITGAQTVVSQTVTALLEKKMVVLKISSDLPWPYSMRNSINAAFQERNKTRDVIIEYIDAAADNHDNIEPGRFVLQRFASFKAKNGYREKSQVTIQEYITQKNVIKKRIIWVKGLSGKTANQ